MLVLLMLMLVVLVVLLVVLVVVVAAAAVVLVLWSVLNMFCFVPRDRTCPCMLTSVPCSLFW